jgi:mycothiol synthase
VDRLPAAPYPHPMDLTLRGLAADDIPAWCALLAAVEDVEHTGEHYNEADLAEELANPDIEIGKDVVGAFDGDQLVGHFGVYARAGDAEHLKIHLEGAVHPRSRGRGIGTLLVDAMIARADAVHSDKRPEAPARLTLTGLSANAEQQELLADAGLMPERWNFGMRTTLVDPPAPGPLPHGLVLRTYDESLSAAMLEAHNEAFLDHPGFTAWTDAEWRQWVTGSRNFRPDLSVVVVAEQAPERVLGYVQSNEFDAYFQATGRREGYVAKVGTRREVRGRGLAGTMLRECLRRYADAGLDEAALDVDSANPTGALGVYERVGFEVETRWTNYALVREPL